MPSIPQDRDIHAGEHEPIPYQAANSTLPTHEQRNPSLRVSIVGGGIGGLCLGLGLRKHPHINVQIYEAAHEFSEIGAGIGVGKNAQRALELLGPDIYAAYKREATEAPFRICNGQGQGELASSVLIPPNSKASQSTVHRAKFLKALVELVPSGWTHFDKRLVNIEDGTSQGGSLILKFRDGTTAEADAIIGADGIHSHTRDHVLDDEPEKEKYQLSYSGAVLYRCVIPMEKVVQALGTDITQYSSLFIVNGAMAISYPVDHHTRLNAAAYTWKHKTWTKKEWAVPVDREEVLSSYRELGLLDPKLIELLNLFEDASAWAIWDLPNIPKYNRGAVCIMGDAAHAPSPFQGQGAAQAIEDSLTLTDLFAHVKTVEDVSLAFAAFDQVRRPRANKNVTESRKTGRILSRLDPKHTDVREIADGFPARMKWLWMRDLEEQSRDAVKLFERYKDGGSAGN